GDGRRIFTVGGTPAKCQRREARRLLVAMGVARTIDKLNPLRAAASHQRPVRPGLRAATSASRLAPAIRRTSSAAPPGPYTSPRSSPAPFAALAPAPTGASPRAWPDESP